LGRVRTDLNDYPAKAIHKLSAAPSNWFPAGLLSLTAVAGWLAFRGQGGRIGRTFLQACALGTGFAVAHTAGLDPVHWPKCCKR
jgi:hypothetical protein